MYLLISWCARGDSLRIRGSYRPVFGEHADDPAKESREDAGWYNKGHLAGLLVQFRIIGK
jgi:hypothetical protein